MRIVRRVRADVGVVALVLAAGGCVEPFDGSNVQIDFNGGVQPNPRAGDVVQPDQPPINTHYILYGSDLEYDMVDGHVVLDDAGQPVIKRAYLYEVKRFEISPVIDVTSPCFIDTEESRFPGLHVTQYAAEVRRATGITDPFLPGQNRDDVVDVLTADQRMLNLPQIASALLAVTSHADFRYPGVGTACVNMGGDPAQLPPITCVDPESNAVRLRLCQQAWAANPEFYEGSDKVFTLPLSGEFFGMVEGSNPINGGFVGGSGFFVPANLVGLEAYAINWQYDDLDHDPEHLPDVPAGSPSSPIGFPYMQGKPEQVTRGTITVALRHATNSRITATMAIFPNLGHDDVHF